MAVSAARSAAYDILLRIEQQQAYAAELLHSTRLDDMSNADCGLAMEIVMGVLRWRSLLDAAIREFSFSPMHKLDVEVLTALRIGAYQLQFLERVPGRAAVNESVELVKQARKVSAAPLVNAVLRKIASFGKKFPTISGMSNLFPEEQAAETLSVHYAHPRWLVERWIREYGTQNTQRVCEWDQTVPVTALRLRGNAEETEAELSAEGISLEPGALIRSARRVVSGDCTRTRAFAEGRVAIQDEGSQLIAALVGRGEHLLDCCAAPGGKTAALADHNPKAKIVATDLHEHRLRVMRKLVKAENVQIVAADAMALPFSERFDRVLADVPCSGTGTLARNPEIKWRLKPEDVEDLHDKQLRILRSVLDRVAVGGRLVYSSCSMEPEENVAVIEEVLAGSSEFRVVDCLTELERLRNDGELVWSDLNSLLRNGFLRTIPGVHPCDGFFGAIVERSV